MKKNITIELPEELAEKLRSLDASSIQHVVEEDLKAHEKLPTRTVNAYLPYMRTGDTLSATRQAKEESSTPVMARGRLRLGPSCVVVPVVEQMKAALAKIPGGDR